MLFKGTNKTEISLATGLLIEYLTVPFLKSAIQALALVNSRRTVCVVYVNLLQL